jgi:hypothetical protein
METLDFKAPGVSVRENFAALHSVPAVGHRRMDFRNGRRAERCKFQNASHWASRRLISS